MRTTTRLVTVAASVLGAALLGPAVGRAHIAEFTASLDAAQETPPIALPDAGGMGDFTLEEDGTMQATVTFQGLSGPAILAHIHQGPVGVAGPIVSGYTVPQPGTAAGTITGVGAAPFTTHPQQQTLFSGGMYFNIHTPMHPGGEIRGQLILKPGTCSCDNATNPGAFKKCVKKALKGVEKSERKADSVKKLKKLYTKASCGKTKAGKKAVACCLPITPAQNIVTDQMCASVKANKCTSLGGTSAGTTGVPCSPNPCQVGSPSGAFL